MWIRKRAGPKKTAFMLVHTYKDKSGKKKSNKENKQEQLEGDVQQVE